jgi:hypothetical protein
MVFRREAKWSLDVPNPVMVNKNRGYISRQGNHINRKICAATGPKPRMGFHMMNLLRRLAGVFRIDSIDMNALTGNVETSRA